VALADPEYRREYVEARLSTRDWIARSLSQLGFECKELPGPYVFVKGDRPEPLAGHTSVLRTQNGWLWAIGTPDQVEDEYLQLESSRMAQHG
jgi:hypothetical protein